MFYSAIGGELGSISADSSVTTLRSWSGNVNIQASHGGSINLTAGYFKVKRGSNTVYADVATIKVGTGVPSASSLENGEIYIQY